MIITGIPMYRVLLLLLVSFFLNCANLWSQSTSGSAGDVPRLAVFPFSFPEDPDYGVFMSDRLIVELMHHRDIPALQSQWFDLVESDTLKTTILSRIWGNQQKIEGEDLQSLRKAARSDWALIGRVKQIGIREISLKLIDLKTGQSPWQGKARDDLQWLWVYQNIGIGELVATEIVTQLGFTLFDRRLPSVHVSLIPQKLSLGKLYNNSLQGLTSGYEKSMRQQISRSDLFQLTQNTIGIGTRFLTEHRKSVHESTGSDAALCGSLLALGKDGNINNTAVALRLVDLPSGRILWAGNAGSKRVWRKEGFDKMSLDVTSQLIENLAFIRTQEVKALQMNTPADNDGLGWANLGILYLRRGLLSAAEEAFLKAKTQKESQLQAYWGLGEVYSRRPAQRQQAIQYYKQVLDIDSTRADIYYKMAMVYQDIGTNQGLEMAHKALQIDPNYGAAYRFIADWYAKGEWYTTSDDDKLAVEYYSKYIQIEPDDDEARFNLGIVLLRLKDYSKIARIILPSVQQISPPIELLPIIAQWAYAIEKFDQAAKYWRLFLGRVNPQEKKLYISPESLLANKKKFQTLSQTEKDLFVDHFWHQKDLDITTSVNERQLEHFHRIWTARRYFSESVHPWDKRGDVYIRYGEPDYRSRSNRVPTTMKPAVEQIREQMYAELYMTPTTESLVGTVYPIRSSKTMVSEEAGLLFNADSHTQGDGFMPVGGGIDHSMVPWESWVYVSIGNGIEITFTDELGIGRFDFAPAPSRIQPGMRSLSRLQEYAPESIYEQVANDSPDLYQPFKNTKEFNFFFDHMDFKGTTLKTSSLDVVFGLPVDESKLPNNPITLSMALYDSTIGQVYRDHKQVSLPLDFTGQFITDILKLDIPPGSYRLLVKAQNHNNNQVGLLQKEIEIEDYNTPGLHMSDLVMAAKIIENSKSELFRKESLSVVPAPSNSIQFGQQLGLYFEIYNLKPDIFGQMKYRVRIEILFDEDTASIRKLLSKQNAKSEVSLSFEQVGRSKDVQNYQFVDLSAIQTGRNLLKVSVEDLNSQQRVEKEHVFIYGK